MQLSYNVCFFLEIGVMESRAQLIICIYKWLDIYIFNMFILVCFELCVLYINCDCDTRIRIRPWYSKLIIIIL